MQAVSDATPLIHLAKISKISYLMKLFSKILIPGEIFEEVVTKGKEQNKKEVAIIENLIEEGFVIVKDVTVKMEIANLHLGELKALALCKEMKIKNILIDEKEGVDTAVILGLKPLRTTALLLRLLRKNLMTFSDYKESLLTLSESGYFLSAETYEKLLETGRNVK